MSLTTAPTNAPTTITDINDPRLKPKSAENIHAHAGQIDGTNRYLAGIVNGARVMVARGKGDFRYRTQLSEGSTQWAEPGSPVASETVKKEDW